MLCFESKVYINAHNESINQVDILSTNSILVHIDYINGGYLNGNKEPVIYSFFQM